MEGFSDLLHKLQEAHEREVEGWQVKVQELSNKKGCDTKRMEELFARNQQMKEQQRVLTENIKTLENRLRAGLCDRCTVTQEVAKKRQHEYEASQMQSLQHISLLAGEMSGLKKENKGLRDEVRSLRAALEGHGGHSSSASTTTEVKLHSSPDVSPSSVPTALVAASSVSSRSSDGDGGVKTEADQRSEEAEHSRMRGMSRSPFVSFRPFPLSALTLPSRKAEHTAARVGEKRAPSVEGLDQRPATLPHPLLLKSSSSSPGEVITSRHVLHAPVPCRPQPIKGSPVSLPWSLSESCDWVNVAAAGGSMVLPPSPKPSLIRLPNIFPTSQHASSRRQGHPWPKRVASQPPAKEPTVVLRLKSLEEQAERHIAPREKKEPPPLKVASSMASAWHREANEVPLDLSDRGKPKPGQTPRDDSPLNLQDAARAQKTPDGDVNTHPSTPSPLIHPSSCSTPPDKQREDGFTADHSYKVITEQEQKEEVNGKTGQGNEKKVPVLTVSLRPVVVLETLNSALRMQESLSSNGKPSAAAVELGSSSDEADSVSGQESSQRRRRKRPAVETASDLDSDTDDAQRERKLQFAVRREETSPS